MGIRVTQSAVNRGYDGDLQSIYAKMAKAQKQIATGVRVNTGSDDPYASGQIISYNSQLANIAQYRENAAQSVSLLDAADSALDTASSALREIHNLALRAANDTNGVADRTAIAAQITQLKEVVRDSMNAKMGDTYLFGGTASGAAPYPAPGNTYVGSTNVMTRRVGDGVAVNVNADGSTIFGPAGANVLDEIDQLVLDVGAGSSAGIQTDLGSIESLITGVTAGRTQLGGVAARLESIQTSLDLTEERLQSAVTDARDADPTEAYMEFSQQQTMYQAALAAGTRMMQTSILDFI